MAAHHDVDGGQYHQQNTGHDTGSEHLAHRHTGNQGIEDHQNAGRNQYAPAPAGVNHPQGHLLVIAPLKHRWQCDGAHGDDRRATDADHGCKNGADAKGANREATPQAAAPEVHHAVQVFGNPGSLQNHRHEDEQGDRHQGKAFHGAPDLRGHHVEGVESPGEVEEDNGYAAQHKGQWQAQKQEKQQGAEEQQREDFNAHNGSPLASSWGSGV